MRFFRRIASLLGIAAEDDWDGDGSGGSRDSSDDAGGAEDGEQSEDDSPRGGGPAVKGFGVQVPIVVPCDLGDEGGLQGFKWYTRSLRIDEDGDVADEFLDQVEAPTTAELHTVKFQVKYVKTRPPATDMRKHAFAANGNILHSLQYQGIMTLA